MQRRLLASFIIIVIASLVHAYADEVLYAKKVEADDGYLGHIHFVEISNVDYFSENLPDESYVKLPTSEGAEFTKIRFSKEIETHSKAELESADKGTFKIIIFIVLIMGIVYTTNTGVRVVCLTIFTVWMLHECTYNGKYISFDNASTSSYHVFFDGNEIGIVDSLGKLEIDKVSDGVHDIKILYDNKIIDQSKIMVDYNGYSYIYNIGNYNSYNVQTGHYNLPK